MLLVTKIDTFYNGLTLRHRDTINVAAGGTFMQKTLKECYELIENMTAHHNHWVTSATRDKASRTINSTTTTESPEVILQLDMLNKNFQEMIKQMQSVKSVDTKCETCGGPYSYTECPAIDGYTQEAAYATTGNYNSGVIPTNRKMQMQSSSGSRSLPSNTVANPRCDLKAITTRSGAVYDGPMIPPTSSPLPKKVEREIKATKDKVQATSSESTAHVQPPVVQVPIPEPDVASKTNPKPSILYPSRLNDQKLCEKTNNQMLKFLQIFQRLHFDISFADALFHMPKFASTFKSLLTLADLDASINLMPLPVCQKLSLRELTSTHMTLELANRSIVIPTGVAEDVFVKVRKFYFLADFVVVDYDVDPRVPLILGRHFLRMTRALIDVHGEELTLRVNDEAILFKVGHTSRYSRNYYDKIVHQVNVIDVACEEYAQEIRTPDEITNLDDDYYDTEGDVLYLEKLLNEDPSPNLPPMKNEDLKQVDASMNKPLIEEPPKLELKDLPSHLEYAFLEGTDKLPGGMTIIENEDNELIPTRLVTEWCVCIDYRKLNDATRKDHFPLPFMDQMLERLVGNEYYSFLDGAVLGQRKTKHFQPIQYASKTMTDAQAHYTTMEKELLAVVYAFEKLRPYLVLSNTIVYTDHSALKYLLAKQDAKPRLLRWILLLQKFDVIIRDQKGAENLVADHVSRLQNPHLEKKQINENFPLENLGMISFNGNSSTPLFTDIANYHAGNFVVKGMSSPKKIL
uniref:RNA-directed DNA polymerase n=1 Tax=Tanacetum cinerariifolium TaxID=118510 RepID=A0A6L2LNL2_TANCI|nr:reverse transcriptase domain-containing protein [Tanacetum cinerariifolium]